MDPQFTKKRFSVFYGSPAYDNNFDQAFSRYYFISFIEEWWQGQKVKHMGRAEITDERKESPYADEEIPFAFNDTKKYQEIRDKWDWKHVNKEELDKLRNILKTEMEGLK